MMENEHTCKKCNITKDVGSFPLDKTLTKGHSNECRSCKNERQRIRRKNNPEQTSNYSKKYYNPEKRKEYSEKNRDYLLVANKIYRENNKDKRKAHYESNKEKIRLNYNKEAKSIYNKEYARKNRDKISQRVKERRQSDPLFRMKEATKCRVRCFIINKGFSKKNTTKTLLGIDYNGLKLFIERQFTKGMTWNNYGKKGWEIDHKIPLASAKTEQELLILFHYKNLQPLWRHENIQKSDKILPFQTYLPV